MEQHTRFIMPTSLLRVWTMEIIAMAGEYKQDVCMCVCVIVFWKRDLMG